MYIYDQFLLYSYYLFQVNVNNHHLLKQEVVLHHQEILIYELMMMDLDQDYRIIENQVDHN